MPYQRATNFKLHSLDHDETLFGGEIKSVRHLVEDVDELVTPEGLNLAFKLGDNEVNVNLKRELGAMKEGATMTLLKEGGEQEVLPAPKVFAYYNEGRDILLTFQSHNRFEGLIINEAEGEVHHLIGEDGELHVNAEINDILEGPLKLQGRNLQIDVWNNCFPGQDRGLARLDMGGAIGFEMFQEYGSTDAVRRWGSYLTQSNTIYERQMSVSLNSRDTVVATSTNAAPWTSNGCSRSIQTQLSRLSSWSKPTNQDLWHLVDDCFSSSSGILGVAYLGTLCAGRGVGVNYMSDQRISTVDYPTWSTVAHEIGHNFNAQHSFENGQGSTGGIMDYGPFNNKLINGVMQFNTRFRRTEVCREVTSAANNGCLTLGSGGGGPSPVPSPVTSPGPTPTPAPTPCPFWFGCAVEAEGNDAERELNCRKHRNQQIIEGELLFEQLSGMSLADCRSACASREACTSFTFNSRYGSCSIEAGGMKTIHGAEFDTYTCGDDNISETLDDILETANIASLLDTCCTVTAGVDILGMNSRAVVVGDSMEMCQVACVTDSSCTGIAFDSEVDECVFFDRDNLEFVDSANVDATVCSRQCIAAAIGGVTPIAAAVNVPAIAAGAAAVTLVGALAALLVIRRNRAEK